MSRLPVTSGHLRAILHGLVLCGINLLSVGIGFGVYRWLRPARQTAIEVPVAAVFSVGLFLLWIGLVRHPGLPAARRRFALRSGKEHAGAFAASLLWQPALFVPIHYATQGYWTALSNLIALLAFQIPVNLLAVGIASAVSLRGDAGDETPGPAGGTKPNLAGEGEPHRPGDRKPGVAADKKPGVAADKKPDFIGGKKPRVAGGRVPGVAGNGARVDGGTLPADRFTGTGLGVPSGRSPEPA